MAGMSLTDPPTRRHRVAESATIDIATPPSVSFAPPETVPTLPHGTGRASIAVGPGRQMMTPPRSGTLRDVVNGFPIQLAKVQRPALRDETLERPRLLDWLRAKTTGRVVLLLADAGYGKTTLLADFSRRTRMRTLWYRLDHEDRDWTSLLHHLVAAGREHDPDFAPGTASLLADVGVSGPSRDDVLDTFLRELPTVAGDAGAMIILDDFHLVDDADDARHIARELVARAPERMCVVFASRRVPTVPLARLRAVGEVAELLTDHLRFDAHETETLFNETYGRQLEPDVVRELARRTEGWAASLQMVNAALRDRSTADIRTFVRGLSGADQDLYDYLAEEVVGDLPTEQQRFLMETSILQVVTPELAQIATGLGRAEVTSLSVTAERMTLLTRRTDSPRTHQRYHPLVREFLEARLRTLAGDDAVRALHVRVADATADEDWRLGAHHYREAGAVDQMVEVVGGAIATIMGNGQYALAGSFIADLPAADRPPSLALITSRVDMQQGDYQAAIDASQEVLDNGLDDPVQRDHAILNLMTLHLNLGDGAKAVEFADLLGKVGSDDYMLQIASTAKAMVAAATVGDLDDFDARLRKLLKLQHNDKALHLGVTLLNLATVALLQDRGEESAALSTRAIESLSTTSGRLELGNAVSNFAEARARAGHVEEALESLEPSVSDGVIEARLQYAQIADSYGDRSRARLVIELLATTSLASTTDRFALNLILARHYIRDGQHAAALNLIDAIKPAASADPGLGAAVACTRSYCLTSMGHAKSNFEAQRAIAVSSAQNAHSWTRIARILEGASSGQVSLSDAIASLSTASLWAVTYVADIVVGRLDWLNSDAFAVARAAAMTHPARWRFELRRAIDGGEEGQSHAVGRLLEDIGERQDVRRLRAIARRRKRDPLTAGLGRSLARRVAHQVRFEDQGRVTIQIGPRVVPGSALRRKVLALACYLISRPQLSSTRDQVLDALWPDLDPTVAVNSLNQTVYFLRRVFEEDYVEDESPGYLHHDSDVVWLDPDLVSSRSADCREFLRTLGSNPAPDEVDRLLVHYRGRFALDFEYEEWAADHRDGLHAAFLEVAERSVRSDLASGHYDRGIRVARAALLVEPSAEQIEVTLLRLYRLAGAHAAAAEQYTHYAGVLRDQLGVEPPPLESL